MRKSLRFIRAAPFIFLLLLAFPPALQAAEIRVPADQPTIQAGIDAAVTGDTVLVADGQYQGPGNRDLDFNGKAITVRSEGGAEVCSIVCGGSVASRHRGFYFHNGEGRNSVVEGFTIRAGYVFDLVHPWTSGGGAGINCYQSSPTIRDCTVQSCTALGPGLAILCSFNADPLIENCVIRDNIAAYPTSYAGSIYCNNASPEIIGCNISGTRPDYGSPDGGGGIYCDAGSDAVIVDCTIADNWGVAGGGIQCRNSSPIIRNNVIVENLAVYAGGGISLSNANEAVIEDNVINHNSGSIGGGISLSSSSCNLKRNTITDNDAFAGGGIFVIQSGSVRLDRHVIARNQADQGGGCAIREGGSVEFNGCTITGNSADDGGGLSLYGTSSSASMINSILWGNDASAGGEVFLGQGEFSVSWSDVQEGQSGVHQEPGTKLDWGQGVIDADPLFAHGPGGDHYLSHIAAGQAADSPCIDAGYPGTSPPNGTTRTDGIQDGNGLDLGYYYWRHESSGSAPDTAIEGGPDGLNTSPMAVFYFTGTDAEDPPGALHYSWRLDDGDWSEPQVNRTRSFTDLSQGPHSFTVIAIDTDGNVDPIPAVREFEQENSWWTADLNNLVTAPGPCVWNPPLIRTYFGQWLAYSTSNWGVNVASGDLDGDGNWDVVTGPGPGPGYGPHVQCFDHDGSTIELDGFLAYGTASYGVNVAMGDLDGDGDHEIITGAGPSPVFGPHVRGFDFVYHGIVQPMPEVSFLAYGTPRWGVNVSTGDIDGDGYDEIVTGAGPGAVFGPHVRAFDYDGGPNVIPIPGVSFFAYGTLRWGVKVACGDLDGDGMDEIITGPGPSSVFGAHVRAWSYDGVTTTPVPGVSFFAYDGWRYGVNISTTDIDDDHKHEILTMPGPDPEATAQARVWSVDDGTVTLVRDFPAFDPWMTRGGTIAGAKPVWRRK